MDGLLGLRMPYAGAAHVIPLFSMLYYVWAGVVIAPTLHFLMWVLLIFCSLPMLAYLETMKVAMAKYTPGLSEVVKRRMVPGAGLLSGLRAILPAGGWLIVLVLGHLSLYALVIWVAVESRLYLVLGAQAIFFSYIVWIFVFFRVHMRQSAKGPPP